MPARSLANLDQALEVAEACLEAQKAAVARAHVAEVANRTSQAVNLTAAYQSGYKAGASAAERVNCECAHAEGYMQGKADAGGGITAKRGADALGEARRQGHEQGHRAGYHEGYKMALADARDGLASLYDQCEEDASCSNS